MTDFGMSMLEGMNPRMTPLTMCPGTMAYMPPEALITLPRYSNKLDCFSHGVLAIQMATRRFPNPTRATITIEDARSPTGTLELPVPERECRKKDIDLVDPNHPLLPLALHCLKDRDTERPSADELCGRLATLKGEQMYTRSVEQSRSRESASVQTLQQQIREKDGELARARANHETELHECHVTFQQQIQEKDGELARARANHQVELNDYHTKLQKKCDELNSKESEMEQVIADCRAQVQTHESVNEQLRKENRELCQNQKQQKAPQAAPQKQQRVRHEATAATDQVSDRVDPLPCNDPWSL